MAFFLRLPLVGNTRRGVYALFGNTVLEVEYD